METLLGRHAVAELQVLQDAWYHGGYPHGHLLLAQQVEGFHQAVQGRRVVLHCFYRLFQPQK